ncbi:MAG: hypothetical protein ACREOI_21985 [bacterium]
MARFDQILFDSGFVTGSTRYDDHYQGDEKQNRIVLTITPEKAKYPPIKMIVDTGAPWCILDPDLAEAWDLTSGADDAPITNLNIRGEAHRGRLTRANIILEATNGEDLTVEATFFVPEADEVWSYPNFLGLSGFLDRIRFAVDASDNAFYFGRFDAPR